MANPFEMYASPSSNQIQQDCNSIRDCGVYWEDIDSLFKNYQENPNELSCMSKAQELQKRRYQQVPCCPNVGCSTAQPIPQIENPQTGSYFPDLLELASSSTRKFNSLDGESSRSTEVGKKLSTEQILRLAGERFVQFSSQTLINLSMFMHPYSSSLSSLSAQDKHDVELAQLLLAAAEKVGYKQFDQASRLLSNCQWVASSATTPIQRSVHYIAKALFERIKKETGNAQKGTRDSPCLKRDALAFIALTQKLPYTRVFQFTTVQTILDNVAKKSKVHLIDFHISSGSHWAVFMQDIANRDRDPMQLLKITAVETIDRHRSEEAGKRLGTFASYFNLAFSYKVVFIPDMKDLREEDFDIDPEEAVAVNAPFMLGNLISKPVSLKNLMTVVRKIKPLVMVVSEVEANHNSPSFVNRFIEALFYYSALLDSLAEGMAEDDRNRMEIEQVIYHNRIHSIVAEEGDERVTRSVPISVWRAFFSRFGLVELELSTSCVYQACLIVEQFSCGKSCNLNVNSKCLLVGWKGTPLYSVSAWKFM